MQGFESLERLVEVKIGTYKGLGEDDEKVVERLVEASKQIDKAYLRQVYSRNLEILERLEKENNKIALKFFKWNKGPWDRLNGYKPVLTKEKRAPGLEFYPKDMAKEEFDKYAKGKKKKEFESYYTVIRRSADGLVAVKYSEEYKEELEEAARIMNDAASISKNSSLARFLRERAKAFITNTYADSERLWLGLDSGIEPTIGPYEVYDDELLGYKSSFESFIGIVDREESRKMKIYTSHLGEIDRLATRGIKYPFERKAQISPISVVNEVYAAGSANAGYTTSAYNLPNDDTIRKKFGSKKVLLKNIMKAKYEHITKRLDEEVFEKIGTNTWQDLFSFVLFHELSHGMGPGTIRRNGHKIQISQALQTLYSPIEEAKADALGLYSAFCYMDKGVIEKSEESNYMLVYISSIIRSMRSGIQEAHAAGAAMSYNFLKEQNAFAYDGKYELRDFKKALLMLLNKYLTIEASGSMQMAKKFSDKYLKDPEDVKEIRKRLEKKKVPIDIFPVFDA